MWSIYGNVSRAQDILEFWPLVLTYVGLELLLICLRTESFARNK